MRYGRSIPLLHWAIGGSASGAFIAATLTSYCHNHHSTNVPLTLNQSKWKISTLSKIAVSWICTSYNRMTVLPTTTTTTAQCYYPGTSPRVDPKEYPVTNMEDRRKVVSIEYEDESLKPLLPIRFKPKYEIPMMPVNLHCNQHIYFWGNRENLPYGFDGITNKITTNSEGEGQAPDDDVESRPSRGSTRPYLEDVGPQLDGHFKPHASRWFDTHQYNWKSIELGSHFGAALTKSGDVSKKRITIFGINFTSLHDLHDFHVLSITA